MDHEGYDEDMQKIHGEEIDCEFDQHNEQADLKEVNVNQPGEGIDSDSGDEEDSDDDFAIIDKFYE